MKIYRVKHLNYLDSPFFCWSSAKLVINKITLVVSLLLTPMLLHSKTLNMGYWLDQAVVACAINDKKELKRITRKINRLVETRQELQSQRRYLLTLVKKFNAGKCFIPIAKKKENGEYKSLTKKTDKSIRSASVQSQTVAHFSLGSASNINNGADHNEISINNLFGAGKVSLTIGEESQPLADTFYSTKLSHYQPITDKVSVYGEFKAQRYKHYEQFNFNTSNVGIDVKTPSIKGGYNVSVGGAWLDKKLWEKSIKAVMQTPLYTDNNSKLTGLASLKASEQVTQGDYIVVKTEAGLSYHRSLSDKLRLDVSAKISKGDVVSGKRSGGDKLSKALAISTQYRLNPTLKIETQLAYADYKDEESYSVALFGLTKRQQKRERLAIYLEKDLGKNRWVDVSYVRDKLTDDAIVLFDTPWNDYVNIGVGYRW